MNAKVAILMGSDTDLEVMNQSADVLNELGVSYDVKVLSAHRSPDLLREYVGTAEKSGVKVFIAGAGGAAHLAGVIAAHTKLPVIGVPIDSSPLKGMDALLATVQMPAGIPVATVAIGKAGGRNAGILAAQILAIADSGLSAKLDDFKKKLAESVKKKNEKIQDKISRPCP